MKSLVIILILLLSFSLPLPNPVLGSGPLLSQLAGTWNGSLKLSGFNLGEPPASPALGEKVLCDPQIYHSVKQSLEEIQAKRPIPAALAEDHRQ